MVLCNGSNISTPALRYQVETAAIKIAQIASLVAGVDVTLVRAVDRADPVFARGDACEISLKHIASTFLVNEVFSRARATLGAEYQVELCSHERFGQIIRVKYAP